MPSSPSAHGSSVPDARPRPSSAQRDEEAARHRLVISPPTTPEMRELLGRVARRQQRSAAMLRARGRGREAHLAERWAGRVTLTLDEPRTVARMQTLTQRFADATRPEAQFELALEGAMSL